MPSLRSSVACSLATLCLTATVGCGDGRIEVYPVRGSVTVGNKPAAGATVIFYAQDEALKQPGIPIPQGTVDDDGSFQLTSFELNDGAPAGEFKVTVVWNEVIKPSDDPESVVEQDRLKGRYATPDQSGLTATVTEGDNQLPPFVLK